MEITLKRLLSLAIAVIMVVSLAPLSGLQIYAAEVGSGSTEAQPEPEAQSESEEPSRREEIVIDDTVPAATGDVNINNDDLELEEVDGKQMAVCPVCEGDAVEWTALGEEGAVVEDTVTDTNAAHYHYYLAEDFGQKQTESVENEWMNIVREDSSGTGPTVCLHTNGKTAYLNGHIYIGSGSTLNVMGNGTLVGNYYSETNVKGSVITVHSGSGVLNLYGSKIVDMAGQTNRALAISHASSGNGKIYLYDEAVVVGGVELVNSTQTKARDRLYMYGGVIRNGDAELDGELYYNYVEENGGNIVAGSESYIYMYGGKILNGRATGNGGNIYISGDKSTSFVDLFLENGLIEGGEAGGAGGNIYWNLCKPQSQSSGDVDKMAAYFGLDTTDGTTQLKILDGKAGSDGGNVYLANSGDGRQQRFRANTIIAGGEATGNGGNIYNTYTVHSYGMVVNGTAGGDGGNIYISGNYSSYFFSGRVANGTAGGNGGNIFSTSTKALDIYTAAKVDGGIATKKGGNVSLSDGTVTVSGTVTGGESGTFGGNIVSKSLTIKATGEVSNGLAHTYGGNIAVAGGGTFTLNGGKVKDGKAYTNGGNINSNNTAIIIQNNGEISNGIANYKPADGSNDAKTDGRGGNINIFGGESAVKLESGKITGGRAEGTASLGGNVHIYKSGDFIGVFTITDGEVSDGFAGYSGGNISVDGAILKVNGGEISGGSAQIYDNIYLANQAEMTTTAGTVYGTNGAADKDGDAIGVSNSTLRLGGTTNVLRNDGQWGGLIDIASNGSKLYILDSWTGEAGFSISEDVVPANSYGIALPEDESTALAQCGTYDAETGTFTKSGNVNGTLYYSNSEGNPLVMSKNDDGVLWITGTKVTTAEGEQWVFDANEALTEGAEVTLELFENNTELALNNNDLTLDLNGNNVTLSGTGTVSAIDTANDNFKDFGLISFADGENDIIYETDVTVIDETTGESKRYLAVTDEAGNVSCHRVKVTLVNLGLKTSINKLEDIGYYYQAKYQFDDYLKDNCVDNFGVITSIVDMPGNDFDITDDIWTEIAVGDDSFAAGVIMNSGLISEFLVTGSDAATNASNGDRKVYANPYITVNVGNNDTIVVVADVENAGTDQGFGMSLKGVMVAVDDMMGDAEYNMSDNTKEMLYTFYSTWEDECFGQWTDALPNMKDKPVQVPLT